MVAPSYLYQFFNAFFVFFPSFYFGIYSEFTTHSTDPPAVEHIFKHFFFFLSIFAFTFRHFYAGDIKERVRAFIGFSNQLMHLDVLYKNAVRRQIIGSLQKS